MGVFAFSFFWGGVWKGSKSKLFFPPWVPGNLLPQFFLPSRKRCAILNKVDIMASFPCGFPAENYLSRVLFEVAVPLILRRRVGQFSTPGVFSLKEGRGG